MTTLTDQQLDDFVALAGAAADAAARAAILALVAQVRSLRDDRAYWHEQVGFADARILELERKCRDRMS